MGLALRQALDLGALSAALGVGLCLLCLYLARLVRARSWVVLVSLAGLLAGASLPVSGGQAAAPGLLRTEARVVRQAGSGAVVEVQRGEYVGDPRPPPAARTRLWVRGVEAPIGANVRLLLQVRTPSRFSTPSPHDPWPALRVDGFARLRAPVEVLHAPAGSAVLHEARSALGARLDATLSPSAAPLARALLLGQGSALATDQRDAFRGAGLSHLLAVSGLHVGLVVGVLFAMLRWLFRRRRDPERAAALHVIPMTLGFALMAGGAPSVWRAALMATAVLVCRALRRRPRAIPVLAFAALVFSILNPESVLRPAFLLSLVATLSIVTADLRGGALRSAARVSVRSTLATLPLVLWCFEGVPILGVVANLVVVPVAVFALVPLAFVHALAASCGLAHLSAPPFELACSACTALSSLFESTWVVPPPSNLQGVVLALLSLSLLWAKSWRHIALFLVVGSVALLGAEGWLRHSEHKPGRLRITFVDVGQGDGALVDLPNGQLLLVDAAGGTPDAGHEAMLPLLRARRRSRVDLAIITHPHPDHYGGFAAIADAMPIDEVWASGQGWDEAPHGPAAALLRRLRRDGTDVRFPPDFCGEMRTLGEVLIEVRWPCPRFDAGFDANDNSIVVRLRYGERSVLFTGDIEREAEALLAHEDLSAELLKVPHHGSRTSSTEAFLDAVAPDFAVASCGRFNSFGHPHADVVARYRRREIPLWRTADFGGVIVQTEGESWEAYSAGQVFRWTPERDAVP